MLDKDDDFFILGGRQFFSRLFLGSGKFSGEEELDAVVDASGTQVVTVSLRRVNFEDVGGENSSILRTLRRKKDLLILPNTSGVKTAKEVVRLAKIAREGLGHSWIKLEVTPEPRYLLPDPVETFQAAQMLMEEGFLVLPYINADPVLAKRLEEIGCICVMPLGSPIGSGNGLQTIEQIKIIVEQSRVPVIVDAGLGAPSDAVKAMELGCDAVMVNTAIAASTNPVGMSMAFKEGIYAGRLSYLSGLINSSPKARASSPITGFLQDKQD